jgi:hypothetical protein
MTRKLLALGCAGLAALLLSAAYSPADARRGVHGHGGGHGGARSFGHRSGGPRSFYGGPRFHAGPRFRPPEYAQPRRLHRHFGRYRHIYVGAPIIYGGYTYYYSDCDWMRRRALNTGSGYWWDRYYSCMYGE